MNLFYHCKLLLEVMLKQAKQNIIDFNLIDICAKLAEDKFAIFSLLFFQENRIRYFMQAIVLKDNNTKVFLQINLT